MAKLFTYGFWNTLAGIILRNRLAIIIGIVVVTIALGFQWKNMRFSFTEANLLPDDHPVNQEYQEFLDHFGEEGNLIVIATNDPDLFTPEKFNAWNALADTLQQFDQVEQVIGLGNLQILEKKENPGRFEFTPFLSKPIETQQQADSIKNTLFKELPFYKGLVYSKNTKTVQTALYIDKAIVNKKGRRDFIVNKLQPTLEKFRTSNDLEIHISGMPYIRTLNAQNIIDEIGIFVLLALLVTSVIFFFFFRSFRATFISLLTVIIGVMWSFGVIGLLNYEITVLTAIIPPLIIVIGIPNCIFLINKYQQEIKNHGNKAKSLQRVIAKIGNATLMTNVTTASGFATFILTESKLLKEFGLVASINIIAIFILSLLIIPIAYSYMQHPKPKHLKHLGKTWLDSFVRWMEQKVRSHRIAIYLTSVGLLIVSIIGIYQIKVSGSILDDMPKNTSFFKDIRFFEEEFDGILPLEIMVDTKRKKGVLKAATLKRMEQFQELIIDEEKLSDPLSVVNVVKYTKQAYFNGNPKYYQLPKSNEQNFILSYAKNMKGTDNLLNAYVDSTGQYARITTFMKEVTTSEIERIEANLLEKTEKIFPKERYNISLTGKALIFQKGTDYLIKNLIVSLSLAILLIALFMAWMFRSFRMILISIIPNLLPLLVTAGMMGFVGIPIKPSTILVFSIAFGISVDDTIHFLAKYRQELKANHWKIRRSVYAALRETAVSMFYTSIVLFFGFSVFMTSSFGGTVALGGLVSATLLFAMLSNLLLLPSLLLSLERSIANKRVLREPSLKIIEPKDDELDDEGNIST